MAPPMMTEKCPSEEEADVSATVGLSDLAEEYETMVPEGFAGWHSDGRRIRKAPTLEELDRATQPESDE